MVSPQPMIGSTMHSKWISTRRDRRLFPQLNSKCIHEPAQKIAYYKPNDSTLPRTALSKRRVCRPSFVLAYWTNNLLSLCVPPRSDCSGSMPLPITLNAPKRHQAQKGNQLLNLLHTCFFSDQGWSRQERKERKQAAERKEGKPVGQGSSLPASLIL